MAHADVGGEVALERLDLGAENVEAAGEHARDGGVDFGAMLAHARAVGGPALRKLTFHERARIIKGLGLAIMARKEELYELNYATGATRKDGWIDIEGGAGTLFSFSSFPCSSSMASFSI